MISKYNTNCENNPDLISQLYSVNPRYSTHRWLFFFPQLNTGYMQASFFLKTPQTSIRNSNILNKLFWLPPPILTSFFIVHSHYSTGHKMQNHATHAELWQKYPCTSITWCHSYTPNGVPSFWSCLSNHLLEQASCPSGRSTCTALLTRTLST